MVSGKPGIYKEIFCLEHMRLEGEMESLEHFLRQLDFERQKRGGGSGLEVTSAVFKLGEPWVYFT